MIHEITYPSKAGRGYVSFYLGQVERRFFSMIFFMGAISSKVVTISSEVVEVFFLRCPFQLVFLLC